MNFENVISQQKNPTNILYCEIPLHKIKTKRKIIFLQKMLKKSVKKVSKKDFKQSCIIRALFKRTGPPGLYNFYVKKSLQMWGGGAD